MPVENDPLRWGYQVENAVIQYDPAPVVYDYRYQIEAIRPRRVTKSPKENRWAFARAVRAFPRHQELEDYERILPAVRELIAQIPVEKQRIRFIALLVKMSGWTWKDCPLCAILDLPTIRATESYGSVCVDCYQRLDACQACGRKCDKGYRMGDHAICRHCFENRQSCQRCATYETKRWHGVGGRFVCDGCYPTIPQCDNCGSLYLGARCPNPECLKCRCEAVQPVFAFPIVGGSIPCDTPYEVTLPAGAIAAEGVAEINHLFRQILTRLGYENTQTRANQIFARIEPVWMKAAGGSYTKRLSKEIFNTYNYSFTPDEMTAIGNLAKQHTVKEAAHIIEFTRKFNLSAAEFGHIDSCLWQSYTSSRCAMKGSGGLAIRSFDENKNVDGRAWILPLGAGLGPFRGADLPATAYLVFNGYGRLSDYAPAQVIASLTGMSYRKVAVEVTRTTLYVNQDKGFLIAPQDKLDEFAKHPLTLASLKGKHGTMPLAKAIATARPEPPLDVGAFLAALDIPIRDFVDPDDIDNLPEWDDDEPYEPDEEY